MHRPALCLLLLALVSQAFSKDIHSAPKGEMEVKGLLVFLPEVPREPLQDKGRWTELHRYFPKALASIEADLAVLQDAKPALFVLPQAWENTEDAVFLKQMVKDPDFERLTQKMIQDWKAWQKVLAVNQLNAIPVDPTPTASAPTENTVSTPPLPTPDLRGIYGKSEAMANVEESEAWRLAWEFYNPKTETRPEVLAQLAFCRQQFVEAWTGVSHGDAQKMTERRREIRVATLMLPLLSQSWEPLAIHLNQCSRRFSDLDVRLASQKDPEIQKLRALAKQRFLKRFRNTLWLCNLIWAQAMGDEGPGEVNF